MAAEHGDTAVNPRRGFPAGKAKDGLEEMYVKVIKRRHGDYSLLGMGRPVWTCKTG